MLTLYHPYTGQKYPLDVEYCITHTADGYDQLDFTASPKNAHADALMYEAVIDERDNRYLIKAIDATRARIKVTCALALDDWKRQILKDYRRTDITMRQALTEILPVGWQIVGDLPTNRTTIEQTEGQAFDYVTPYALLPYIAKAFDRQFQFDTLQKVIQVIDVENVPSLGGYLTDELNLKSIARTGNTSDFVTRLHCYGKKDENGNPVTFASINGGKDYVENQSYCTKLIEGAWSDERYTDPQSLLKAGTAKLEELSRPIEAYDCSVIDLQKASQSYPCLEIAIHRKLWLIDRDLHTCVEHRVMEYKEYRGRDNSYAKNTLTLSTLNRKLETKVQGAIVAATQANLKVNGLTRDLNGMYTSADVDKLIQNAVNGLEQEMTDLSGELTGQIQDAATAEQTRADAAYCPAPLLGSVTFSAAGSKTVSVPFKSYFAMLTPNAAGNCWATTTPNTVTIYADAPMSVNYFIVQGG